MAPSGENDPILDLAATLVEAWPRLTAEQQAALVLAAVDDRYGAGVPKDSAHNEEGC